MNWLRMFFSGRPTQAEISYLDRGEAERLAVNAEKAAAVASINALIRMDDVDFVAAVRGIEKEGPSWTRLVKWHEFVRREVDFRLLLKGNQKCT